MGFGTDMLMIIGILPMPMPRYIEQTEKNRGDDVSYYYLEKMPEIDNRTRNFLDLFSLNGSNVSVQDVLKSNYEGILAYNLFDKRYSLKTSEGIINLKVRDLEKITE